jgi:hypothetical protein
VTTSTCPSCGYQTEDTRQPDPDAVYSPACYDCFTQLLARSYSDVTYRRVHQMLVDAYNVQHPDRPDRRGAVQAVAVCLMTLCLFVEDGVDPAQGPRLHKAMADHPVFHHLPPPDLRCLPTAADVVAAKDAVGHERLVRWWAGRVWRAWAPHHATVRKWLVDGAYRQQA